MDNQVENILKEALSLSSSQRIQLIEQLNNSIDLIEPATDKLWQEEVEYRHIDAAQNAENMVNEEIVFSKYKKK